MSKYFKKNTTKGVIEPVKQNIIKGILDRREKEKKKLPKGLQMDTTTGEGANITKLAKGGRVGYKSGTRGCKLAIKGKGRAYGKNS